MTLRCENCGTSGFQLRSAIEGVEAECVGCGTVIPDTVLRAATATLIATEADDPAAPLTAASSNTN